MRTYQFPHFTLEYDEKKEIVTTTFKDGAKCVVDKNSDHDFHGNLTGITGGQYNLLHEMAHHLVALALDEIYCPIVFASAHHMPMPEDAELREWVITAVSYMALSKPMRDVNEWDAIKYFAKRVPNPMNTVYDLRFVFLNPPVKEVTIL